MEISLLSILLGYFQVKNSEVKFWGKNMSQFFNTDTNSCGCVNRSLFQDFSLNVFASFTSGSNKFDILNGFYVGTTFYNLRETLK